VTVAALGVAACGGPKSNGEASKSARQIISDASKATGSASSVQVSGKGTVSSTAVQVDVVDGPGRGGGTITVSSEGIQVVLDGKQFYLKTTPGVIQGLTGSQATAAQDANKWLQTSSTNASVAQLLPLLDITKLATTSFVFSSLPTKQPVTTFHGQSAVPVVDPKGGETVYVAATGKPYILGIKGPASNGGSTLVFSDYDHATIPGPPPGAVQLTPAG
jgi:hypothetical protein